MDKWRGLPRGCHDKKEPCKALKNLIDTNEHIVRDQGWVERAENKRVTSVGITEHCLVESCIKDYTMYYIAKDEYKGVDRAVIR